MPEIRSQEENKEFRMPPPVPKTEIAEVREQEGDLEIDSGRAEEWEKGEDRSFNNGRLAIVCDGLGGHEGGALASQTAVEAIKKYFGGRLENKEEPQTMRTDKAEAAMKKAILEANETIAALKKVDSGKKDMATTISATLLFKDAKDGKLKMVMGQVGDSRVYRLRDAKLEQISSEDSLANSLKQMGVEIDEENDEQLNVKVADIITQKKLPVDARLKRILAAPSGIEKHGITLSVGECTVGDLRNLQTEALNGEKLEPHTEIVEVKKGDVYINSSDGLHDNWRHKDLEKKLVEDQDNDAATISKNMVTAARIRQLDVNNLRTNKFDDVSVTVTKIEEPSIELGEEDLEEAREVKRAAAA